MTWRPVDIIFRGGRGPISMSFPIIFESVAQWLRELF
jgi:hypothetical protein